MAAIFFGQYLLERGIIGRDALLDALERQREGNRSLFDLALDEGLIDPGQAAAAAAEYRSSSKSSAKVCIDSGFLSAADAERLAGLEASRRLRIGDALVAGGHLDEAALAHHLEAFEQRIREIATAVEREIDRLAEGDVISAFLAFTVLHLRRFTARATRLRRVEMSDGAPASGARRFAQKLGGDRSIWLAIDLTPRPTEAIARGLLGSSSSLDDDARDDAVCEFVNLLGGNACAQLEATGSRLRPEPPLVFERGRELPADGPSVRALVANGEDEIEVHLFLGTAEA